MKETSTLIIVKGDFSVPIEFENQKTISFDELKSWLKSKTFFRHIFAYDKVGICVYEKNYITYPLFTYLLIRLLSRRLPFVLDRKGQKQYITIKMIWFSFTRFLQDWFTRFVLLWNLNHKLSNEMVKGLQIKNDNRILFKGTPVYLRTDLWYGIRAGGSVGHIAGVLNQFSDQVGQPIFLSTDHIPTVRNDIPFYLLHPTDRFWDFQEIPSLASNVIFESQAREALGDRTPSFIYQRYSINNFTGVLLARRYQVPLVLEYNGSEIWIARNWGKPLKYVRLSEKIEKLNLRAADLVVVVSQILRDELLAQGICAKKILVNPNGVDPLRYSPMIQGSQIRDRYGIGEKLVVGFMGTFGLWHGAELLVEAFGRLLHRFPFLRERVVLLMIGQGLTMPQVKENLHIFNLRQNSILTGYVPQEEGAEYMAACDVLVSPHRPNKDGTPFFGSPTKIFEYMAMGKAILASDLGQIGEVLRHGYTAWLVKPGDVDSLIDGLHRLIEDPLLRRNLGEAARREVVANYTWEVHTRRIIEKLREQCS